MECKGKYYGTEINRRWWKRFRQKPFFARGNGVLLVSDESLSFSRKLLAEPIVIPFSKITEITSGTWHAGQWGGKQTIIKIVWNNDNLQLCSGISIEIPNDEVQILLERLQHRLL